MKVPAGLLRIYGGLRQNNAKDIVKASEASS
jgi:hypothetical protein